MSFVYKNILSEDEKVNRYAPNMNNNIDMYGFFLNI